jgi:hypothetical protein
MRQQLTGKCLIPVNLTTSCLFHIHASSQSMVLSFLFYHGELPIPDHGKTNESVCVLMDQTVVNAQISLRKCGKKSANMNGGGGGGWEWGWGGR